MGTRGERGEIGALEVAYYRARLAQPATEIEDVGLSLGNLRAALQAQVAAQGIDPDLLRGRLAGLEAALERFRLRLSPPTQ